MRIHLKINTENEIIPFDHQPLMVGTIHKWLGWNNIHGDVALFSFSRLKGLKPITNGFKIEKYTTFYISAYSDDIIKGLINGIQKDPTMFCNLNVEEIIIEENPDFSTRELFFIGSPIFIKRRMSENETKFFYYNDDVSSQYLKETLQTKMDKVGLVDNTLEICFDKTFANPQIKRIGYNNVQNKASWCNVIIKGKPETKLFAWNVGLGNSTGIGFGAIK